MGRVGIIGDLHISDRFVGQHIDYLANCYDCLDEIESAIIEQKLTHLILLGDLVGIAPQEKNLTKRQTLSEITQRFFKWNQLLNGNLYVVKGNHDIGRKMTDFDFWVAIGVLKNIDYLDVGNYRYHMINYGEETREIQINENMYNIACCHTNLLIEGLTNWYRGGDGVELATLKNLKGVSLVVAGHIHIPSPSMISTSIEEEEINLFYVGNPTRPRLEPNMWEHAYMVICDSDDLIKPIDIYTFKLKGVKEIFNEVVLETPLMVDAGETVPFDLDSLVAILEELQTFNVNTYQDYDMQIKRLAGVDKKGADIALHYLELAEYKVGK